MVGEVRLERAVGGEVGSVQVSAGEEVAGDVELSGDAGGDGLEEGVEDVDLVVKNGFGLRMPVYGIFEHQDAVGLDMGLSIVDYVAKDLYNEPKAPDFYRNKVAAGELGAKTGNGFYDWSKKSIADVKARRDRFVMNFLRSERSKKRASAG